jgi:hypothetical protein
LWQKGVEGEGDASVEDVDAAEEEAIGRFYSGPQIALHLVI